MRMLPLLAVLLLWTTPVLAQPPAPPPAHAATQPAAPARATPEARTPAHHHAAPWERKFARANTSHDGHLTLEQAIRGYITIARHFKAIDTGSKGYVTIDDVRAWHQKRREARHGRARHRNAQSHATGQTSSTRNDAPPQQGGRAKPDASS